MRICSLALTLVVGMVNIGNAGYFLSFGSSTSSPSASPAQIILAPNSTNELINVYMNYDGSGSTAFQGINLYTSLGNGIDPGLEPVFFGTPTVNFNNAVTFQDGVGVGNAFVFDPVTLLVTGSSPYNDGSTIAPQYSNVTATSLSGNVTAAGSVLVAQFRIDTTGISTGTFAINVNDAILGPATYLNNLGAATAFSSAAVNASFIVAVPEPSTLSLVCLVAVGTGLFRRRRV